VLKRVGGVSKVVSYLKEKVCVLCQ